MDDADLVLLLNEAATDLLGIVRQGWYEQPLTDVVRDGVLLAHLSSRGAFPDDALQRPAADFVFPLHREGRTLHYRRLRTRIDLEEQGSVTVTVLEDVTHFRQLDQFKSDFLAAVSHELRTPLTSLGISIELLLQEVTGEVNAVQRDLLQTARDDQDRLKKLVSNLLALTRVESGTYVPVREPVHLAGVVEEALASLRLPFQEKGVTLDGCLSSRLPLVAGEAQHLGWVVTNLIGNALRYTPADGTVTVRAWEADDMITLAVHDTGAGMPADALDTIFDMFVQLKASNETTPGSLGLGLALARRVVNASKVRNRGIQRKDARAAKAQSLSSIANHESRITQPLSSILYSQ
jgi:signal transduction histidine kinase